MKVNFIHQDFIIIYKPDTKIISWPFYSIDLKSITKLLPYKFRRILISPFLSFIWALKFPYFFHAHVKNYKSVFARGSPGVISI
jgi:hypothetical protein